MAAAAAEGPDVGCFYGHNILGIETNINRHIFLYNRLPNDRPEAYVPEMFS